MLEGDKRVIQTLKFVRLYRNRWHFVAKFLEAVGPGLPVLRIWSTAKFGAGGTALDTTAMTEMCADEMFTIYSNMILTLHNIPKRLTSWMEACSCHDFQDDAARKRHIKDKFDIASASSLSSSASGLAIVICSSKKGGQELYRVNRLFRYLAVFWSTSFRSPPHCTLQCHSSSPAPLQQGQPQL